MSFVKKAIIISFICVVCIIAIVLFAKVMQSNLFANATQRVPDTYTELYFENSTKLPTIVTPLHSYPFEFTIHNVENKTMQYTYIVSLLKNNTAEQIDKKTITLQKNGHKTMSENIQIATSIPRSEIIVDLVNKNQQIDFWIQGYENIQ